MAGGKSRYLHVWALDTRKLLRIVELPTKITRVKQLAFLNDSFDSGSNEASDFFHSITPRLCMYVYQLSMND